VKNLYFALTIFFAAVILPGCKKLNPDEEIPSYISVPSCKLVVDSVNQGTSLQEFTDVWVFVNDNFIGTYAVGSKIPILAEGNTVIKMRAGIKNAGISSLRSMYPFTQFYETTVNLVRGQVQTVIPEFNYFSGIAFLKLEDFSSPGTFLSPTPSTDTTLVIYNGTEGLPGQGQCALVHLHDDYLVFDAQSGSSIPYLAGSPCYLEIHYKTNVSIFISVSNGFNDVRMCAIILPTGTWSKMYIPLADYLNLAPTLNNFYFVMHASRLPGSEEAKIYFDNIKIIRQ
jgi:hypothetical protein